jgi:hypothetical protein
MAIISTPTAADLRAEIARRRITIYELAAHVRLHPPPPLSLARRARDHRGRLRRVTAPVLLGSWRCRSGNSVDVSLRRDPDGTYRLEFAWDSPPPLTPGDQADYDRLILPAAMDRVQEFTERLGSVLVLRP